MRATSLMLSVLITGCGGLPSQSSGGDTSGATPGQVDAGADCRWIALVPDTNAQVNGAFCFGVALGASDTLACALASTGEVQCADQLVGDAYIVRWTSSLGSVFGVSGNGPLGTISQLQSDKFEISTATAGRPLGVCTLPNTDITRAVFCAYAQ